MELTPFLRGRTEGLRESGRTLQQIAEAVQKPLNTVKTTLHYNKLRTNGISQPRSGQPLKTNARDRRRILFIIKRNPDATYAKIREETGIEISDSSLYRILQNFHMEHWIKKKRPLLDADHAKARVDCCLEVRKWTYNDWFRVISTDEC